MLHKRKKRIKFSSWIGDQKNVEESFLLSLLALSVFKEMGDMVPMCGLVFACGRCGLGFYVPQPPKG